MMSLLMGVIGFIPGLMSLITTITTKAFDMKVKLTAARLGADENVTRQLIVAAATSEHETTSRLQAMLNHPVMTWLIIVFATPLALFIWKVVVVDIIIGPGCLPFTDMCWVGNTDPIRGEVKDWATTIIACLFGSSTVLAAGKMYFGRDKAGE